MKADEAVLVYIGKPDPIVFTHVVHRSMSIEISEWLHKTYKGGFGQGYYYSHGKIWFRKAKHETMFLLRWG